MTTCEHCHGDHDGCTVASPLCSAARVEHEPVYCKRHPWIDMDSERNGDLLCERCEGDEDARSDYAYSRSTSSQNDYGNDG